MANEKIEWLAQASADMPDLDFARLGEWIEEVVTAHGAVLGHVTYIFCDDEGILDINRRFLNHDYFTDIITFDYCIGRLVRGDIFISLDTVASNAAQIGVESRSELLRVIIHGILHLLGVNDKGPGEREIMEAKENAALARLGL